MFGILTSTVSVLKCIEENFICRLESIFHYILGDCRSFGFVVCTFPFLVVSHWGIMSQACTFKYLLYISVHVFVTIYALHTCGSCVPLPLPPHPQNLCMLCPGIVSVFKLFREENEIHISY